MTKPKAVRCIETLRSLGSLGPVPGTVMMYNCTMFGAQIVPHSPRINITYMWVSPTVRGKGYGSRVLRAVLRTAESHRVQVLARPSSFNRRGGGSLSGLSEQCLRKWYLSHGFEEYSNTHLLWTPQ